MQKRKYIKPEMDIIDLSIEGALLDASGEFDDEFGSVISTEFNKQV